MGRRDEVSLAFIVFSMESFGSKCKKKILHFSGLGHGLHVFEHSFTLKLGQNRLNHAKNPLKYREHSLHSLLPNVR